MTPRPAVRRKSSPFARLRSEHARALARLTRFERALRSARRGRLDLRPFRALERYLEGTLAVHIAAEDGVLYPALTRALPELSLTLEPLREDHDEIRSLSASLGALLAAPRDERRDEQLLVLARDLTDLLRLHLQKEDRSVLGWSERALPAAEQLELQRRVARIVAPGRPRKGKRP